MPAYPSSTTGFYPTISHPPHHAVWRLLSHNLNFLPPPPSLTRPCSTRAPPPRLASTLYPTRSVRPLIIHFLCDISLDVQPPN